MYIDAAGIVDHERVIRKIFPNIERRELKVVNGIVVHQTAAPTAQSTFNSYRNKGANGAHFLIDKDGTIYQTASLMKVANHVGHLQSRCLERRICAPTELKKVLAMGKISRSQYEIRKSWPDRFPWNSDSIGIELVGDAIGAEGREVFENITAKQNESLRWLIDELVNTLKINRHEIYRHSEIGLKNATEARTAKW